MRQSDVLDAISVFHPEVFSASELAQWFSDGDDRRRNLNVQTNLRGHLMRLRRFGIVEPVCQRGSRHYYRYVPGAEGARRWGRLS